VDESSENSSLQANRIPPGRNALLQSPEIGKRLHSNERLTLRVIYVVKILQN